MTTKLSDYISSGNSSQDDLKKETTLGDYIVDGNVKVNEQKETSNKEEITKKKFEEKITEVEELFNSDSLLSSYRKIISNLNNLKITDETRKQIYFLLNKIVKSDNLSYRLYLVQQLQDITSQYEQEKINLTLDIEDELDQNQEQIIKNLVGEIKSIEIIGEYKGGNWKDFEKLLIEKLDIKDEKQKKQILKLIRKEYKKFYEQLAGKIDIKGIGSVLDNMAEQVLNSTEDKKGKIKIIINRQTKIKASILVIKKMFADISEFAADKSGYSELSAFIDRPLNIGEKSITFNSKKEALLYIKVAKEFLKARENINLNDIAFKLIKGTLRQSVKMIWYIDKPLFNIIKRDLDFSATNGIIIGGISLVGHGVALIYLNKFLKEANSGIDEVKYKELIKTIEENIKLYKEAGFSESEIKNLEKIVKSIRGYAPDKEGATIDPVARNRFVYAILQQFRGTVSMDWIRFGSANFGNLFDGKLWGGEFKPLTKIPSGFPLVGNGKIVNSTVSFLLRLQLLPIRLAVASINKGPNGKLAGWGFKTKSSVILEYIEAFNKSNIKFRKIFDIIDSISDFSSDEKKKIKKRILKQYKGDIPTSKQDSLKKWKFNLGLMTQGERIILFNQLESNLKKDGLDIKIKSTKDFLINIFNLKDNKLKNYKSFLKTLNPIENIDRITAEILEEEIRGKLGDEYNTDLKKTIRDIAKNADEFDKNLENIGKIRKKYLNFIEFYPEISDDLEKKLKQILDIEVNLYKTSEELELKLIDILKNSYGLDIDKLEVEEFINNLERTGGGINTNNSEIKKHKSDLIKILNDMEKQRNITIEEKNIRVGKINDFYTSGKTLWIPHYLEILDKLLNGKEIENIKYKDIDITKDSPETFFIEKGIDLEKNNKEKSSKKPKPKESIESKVETFHDLYDRAIKQAELNGDLDLAERLLGEKRKFNEKLRSGEAIKIEIAQFKLSLKDDLGGELLSKEELIIKIHEKDIILKNLFEKGLLIKEIDGSFSFKGTEKALEEALERQNKLHLFKYIKKAIKTGG